MKYLLTLLGFLLFVPHVQSQTVTWPVEVVSELNEYTVSRTVTVPDASSITGLWMKVHNFSYDGKLSVKVNTGAWFTPTTVNSQIASPERLYGSGGIGGAWDTIRLEVPMTDASDGSNTISWRFNGTNGVSSGFRVLDWKFLASDSSEVSFTETRVEDDPNAWAAYSTHADSLSDGATVFTTASLSHPTKGNLSVTCSQCHAAGGEDLKYFNFSNESIVARSKFHGLTTAQARNIASWIRELNAPNPGRIWNPPYQPGPGIDSQSYENWSAGAGIDAVLDTDQEMVAELFPSGINDDGVADTDNYLNLRELKINQMLPDWFNWLPVDHPIDLWGTEFSNHEAYTYYTTDVPATIALGTGSYLPNRLKRDFENWNSAVGDFREGDGTPDVSWTTEDHADANLSLMQWQAVKKWEFMQKHDLESNTVATTVYPGTEEEFTWIGQDRVIFDMAPHISGVGGQGNSYDSFEEAKYRSAAWYHLQQVMNSGNTDPLSLKPNDYKYTFGHTADISGNNGGPVGALLSAEYLKALETMDNGTLGDRGWYMRHTSPYWWARRLWRENLTSGPQFDDWTSTQIHDLGTTLFKAFTEAHLKYPVSQWERGDDHHQLEEATYVASVDSSWGGQIRFDYASTMLTLLTLADARNMPADVVEDLAEWSEDAWPNNNFEQFFQSVTRGDVTGNGTVSSLDASQTQQHVAGLITLTGDNLTAADVSGNGTVSSFDASLILQFVADLISCFPADPTCN